jgi:hypothetical protein
LIIDSNTTQVSGLETYVNRELLRSGLENPSRLRNHLGAYAVTREQQNIMRH